MGSLTASPPPAWFLWPCNLARDVRARIHASCVAQGNGAGPDHLVLNHLPFAEDLRVAKFTSFEDKPEYLPTEEQVQSMNDLVHSLDLKSGIMQSFT